jgi:hypothetical protein
LRLLGALDGLFGSSLLGFRAFGQRDREKSAYEECLDLQPLTNLTVFEGKRVRGFSQGMEGISTALVRAALTRPHLREIGKGIAVLVLWRAFVRRVEPGFVLVAVF